jgi:hypothetical protein
LAREITERMLHYRQNMCKLLILLVWISALGPEGRRFESFRPINFKAWPFLLPGLCFWWSVTRLVPGMAHFFELIQGFQCFARAKVVRVNGLQCDVNRAACEDFGHCGRSKQVDLSLLG